MRDIISKNHIKDGILVDSDEVIGFDDKSKTVIYEVIRVINRVGVFKEDHLSRLDKSLKAAMIERPVYIDDLPGHIELLGETNDKYDFTVKIVIANDENKTSHYAVYIMDCFYPDREMIETGIHTDFMNWDRMNPNTKIVNSGYKDTAAKLMKQHNAFELLLVNSEGYITEGSRTNAFFVIGNKLMTSPPEYILKGITRKYVLAACKRAGLEVCEELLKKEMISAVDGAFVCGTSLKVLPIASCGTIQIPSVKNPLIKVVIDEYDNIMNEYIKKYING